MRESDKRIKDFCKKQSECVIDEAMISRAVELSKKTFYEAEGESRLSRLEFLYQQSQYIRKYLWVLQGAVLFMLWWILKHLGSSLFIAHRSMGVAAPLFVVLLVPELWKNRSYTAMEVEGTTYYNLRQIYAARMMVFGLVDLVLLSVFLAAVSFTARMGIWEFAIQFFIPFNVSCCICFGTLYSKMESSETFAIGWCVLWIFIWVQVVLSERIYNAISAPIWAVILIASLFYLVYSIVRGQKNLDKVWEASLWN